MKVQDLTLEQKIGQLFVMGFPQESPSEEFIRLVRKYQVGNVILFSHNISSAQQLSNLTKALFEEILEHTGVLPLISIDEEGGVVSRLPQDCAVMPSALAQSEAGDEESVYQAARIAGEQLKALGINFNLAPVLDINSNKNNPVIGVRSFGETAEQVSRFAAMAVKGFLDAGILCSGKHFPGHGDTDKDSHLSLPVLNVDKELLGCRELAPFSKLIHQGLPAVTIGHVIVPALESQQIPCTMSYNTVTGLLRKQMQFDGLIISDCMEMAAVKEYYGIAKGAVEGLKAGIDLIFISHTASAVEEAVLAVKKAVEDGELSMERIEDAAARVLAAKEMFGKCDWNMEKVGTKQQIQFAEGFLAKTSRPLDQTKEKKFLLGTDPLFIGIEPKSVTLASDTKGPQNFAIFMQQCFGGEAIECSMNTTEKEMQDCIDRAKGKSSLVVGTLNAHLQPGQCRLLEALSSLNIPLAHIALRNPYDLEKTSDEVFKLPLYEYTVRAMEKAKQYFI